MNTKTTMTVADFVINQLAAWGVNRVFGVPGDSVLALIEAIRQQGNMEFIPARSDLAASLMASAYAKLTGRIGACLADMGPGAIQMLNGVYDARSDRVPLIALTGGLETKHAGTHWPTDASLDLAYEDATVYNRTINDPLQAPRIVQAALRQALTRLGPARVGLPKNILRESIPEADVKSRPPYLDGRPQADKRAVEAALHLLGTAERPVIFAGQGARQAIEPLLQLAYALPAGIVHTIPAIGLIPGDHRFNMGVIGDFGTQAAADVLGKADLVLVVGSTWWQPEYAPRGAKVIQVDDRAAHLGMNFPADVALLGRAEDVLPEIIKGLPKRDRSAWTTFLQDRRRAWDEEVGAVPPGGGGQIAPAQVITALSASLAPDAIVALDVGHNTLWFSRYFRGRGQHVLVSGHWRTVGFALPAAVAAKLAHRERQVVAVAGDGGFGAQMAEFITAVHRGLNLTVVVLKDGVYGEEWSKQRASGLANAGVEFGAADFAAWAEACGGHGFGVTAPADLPGAIRSALAAGKPALVDVTVSRVVPPAVQPLAQQDSRPTAASEHTRPGDGRIAPENRPRVGV